MKAITNGDKCEICGFEKYQALEHHHLIPQEFETNIHDYIVVCANCHKLIHNTSYLKFIIDKTVNKEELEKIKAKYKLKDDEYIEFVKECNPFYYEYDRQKAIKEAVQNNIQVVKLFLSNNRKEILTKIKAEIKFF